MSPLIYDFPQMPGTNNSPSIFFPKIKDYEILHDVYRQQYTTILYPLVTRLYHLLLISAIDDMKIGINTLVLGGFFSATDFHQWHFHDPIIEVTGSFALIRSNTHVVQQGEITGIDYPPFHHIIIDTSGITCYEEALNHIKSCNYAGKVTIISHNYHNHRSEPLRKLDKFTIYEH